jgi:four helix bundle protein
MQPAKFKSFRDIIAWQKAMNLSVAIYRITESFPDSEKFGLVSQLRRASVSIPSNIAEGHALRGIGNFTRCLRIALGSLNEVQTQLELAQRVKLIDKKSFDDTDQQTQEVCKILTALITSIEKRESSKTFD